MKILKKLPSLNALKAFESASRHLSFKLAANELNVTQSAVAQQIRSLEEELGVKLFERHSKGVSLTANGRNYAYSIHQAFALIHEATQSFVHEKQHITISATPTFASKWLIPRLVDFTAMHPDIELQILATEKISHFQNDGVDLAIRYGSPPLGGGLNTALLLQDSFVIVASPQLVKLENQYLSLDNLFNYTFLHDAHNLWSIFLEKSNVKLPLNTLKNIRFNQTTLAIDAAISAQGIALVNPIFIREELQTKKLIQVVEHTLKMETGFYLVSPRHSSNTENLMKVYNWLVSQFVDNHND